MGALDSKDCIPNAMKYHHLVRDYHARNLTMESNIAAKSNKTYTVQPWFSVTSTLLQFLGKACTYASLQRRSREQLNPWYGWRSGRIFSDGPEVDPRMQRPIGGLCMSTATESETLASARTRGTELTILYTGFAEDMELEKYSELLGFRTLSIVPYSRN
jgi:hypothetical protein